MSIKQLNIVSFDVPFPANYGGVIDVYYKIKALYQCGVKIHLHSFYSSRKPHPKLNELCESIHYYKRKTSLFSAFSLSPYIVKSRESNELLHNLLKNNFPVLFEGIHCSAFMSHPKLKSRLKLFRPANVEHQYYWNLFKASSKTDRFYFLAESLKLKLYEKKIKHADLILPITKKDQSYFQTQFPDKKTILLPGFFEDIESNILSGKGEYALYHGNLSVAENIKVAKFLIQEVFSKTDFPLKIAGLNPDKHLFELASKNPKISLIANPKDDELFDLIRKAQFNLMITFQATGLKLKLLHALSKGRFCIANSKMFEGTNLEQLCIKAQTAEEIIQIMNAKMNDEFQESQITNRKAVLTDLYSNRKNAQILMDQLF